ncbi:SMI1/KNR4 family protein [Kitasatospora sp. LaBMicrA B282]|uniref:SMI1/KNR4 family protein n=1 Tax=Kitasatospora sp. LaBMicrA B282 TaxID=3420949 RepID=UPI003D13F7A5
MIELAEQVIRRIATDVVRHAPEGWTEAVLNFTAGVGVCLRSGGYTVAGEPWQPFRRYDFYPELWSLAEAIRASRGWEHAGMEVRWRPTGEFDLVEFPDAVTNAHGYGAGFQVVLDHDYRLPQPGFGQEPGTGGPAGDPDLAVARFRAYMERRASILGQPEQLPPPASATALDEAERRLGRPLPADLRALYLIADGDGIGYENLNLFGNNLWLSLEGLVECQDEWREPVWFGWDLEWDAVVFDANPADTVRRCGGHPGWLPFASGQDGNFLAVDTAPACKGRPGQVIQMGRDYDHSPEYVADSVTSLLGHYLELLEEGAYEVQDGNIRMREPDRGFDRGIAVGEIPAEIPPTLQDITINTLSSAVDLTPLTAAPNLRRLQLHNGGTTDLAPVRALPVETLHVTLDGTDLTPLVDHHHLAALNLGTTVVTDLAPLRTVPNLRCLDLSRAAATDLAVLADLPGLRYLVLTAQQWSVLLDEGNAPPNLAAARLAGADVSFDDALAWSARLGRGSGDAFRLSSTFGPSGS